MTPKAAVLTGFQQPPELRDYPSPPGPEPAEAILCVEMAGICGTEVHLWLGQLAIPLPVILGHETAGRIEKLGAGLTRTGAEIRRLKAIASLGRVPVTCGECDYCRLKRQPPRCVARKAYGISSNTWPSRVSPPEDHSPTCGQPLDAGRGDHPRSTL